MTGPNLSLLHGGDPAPTPSSLVDGAAHLHLSGPVQVHIHLGPAPHDTALPSAAKGPRRFPFMLALLGLALAGGGYFAGTRHPAPPASADTAGLPPSAMLPVPPDLPLPALPQRANELPPAIQQQLARPPVVTPPPGSPAAPGRNPFGLGN